MSDPGNNFQIKLEKIGILLRTYSEMRCADAKGNFCHIKPGTKYVDAFLPIRTKVTIQEPSPTQLLPVHQNCKCLVFLTGYNMILGLYKKKVKLGSKLKLPALEELQIRKQSLPPEQLNSIVYKGNITLFLFYFLHCASFFFFHHIYAYSSISEILIFLLLRQLNAE